MAVDGVARSIDRLEVFALARNALDVEHEGYPIFASVADL
jgi:hypothetical protein